MYRQAAAILLVRHLKELLKSWVYKIDTRKLKLVSLSGIMANIAVFFSPSVLSSSSSVIVSDERLSRLNFSSLAARVICILFKVFADPE